MNIVKVPAINGLGMTAGTEDGPDAIISDASKIDVDINNVEEQEKKIYDYVKKLNKKTIFIGGDHSISYPITKALNEKYKNLKLIILDAHPDLMPPMENPTHEEWLKASIDSGIKSENIIIIGARNIDLKETKHNVRMIPIKEIKNCLKEIEDFSKNSKVYLSIDIDFFDSSVAPATGYPEKNGASKKEGIELIENIISLSKEIVGSDIVEVNPRKKGANKTIKLAREILEILKNKL